MFNINECSNIQELNFNSTSENNTISISPSLFLRLLEWAKEEACGDVCLHQVLENIMSLNGSLTMDMYGVIIKDVCNEESDCDDMASSDDIENAMELGFNKAIAGEELSSDGEDYSLVAGEIITNEKDNGYGASNAEIEAFWQGYDDVKEDDEEECSDCQLFDDTEKEGLEALAKFNQKFNIEPMKKPEPKVELSITPDEDAEIERILKLAKF